MKTDNSVRLFANAIKYFPGGVNSPVRAFRSVSGTPIFFNKGKGCKLTDEDGNEYIDFCCSWGPLISGHADDDIIAAVTDAVQSGTSFGAPTKAENDLAELIIENHPFIEKLRFVSSGTEAVMSAIRLARGYTGRNKILKFEGCYHGHADSLLVKAGSGLVTFGTSSSAGIPKGFVDETIVVSLDSEEAVQAAFDKFGPDIAAIIIEPVPANNGLLIQRKEFLEFLREITVKYGSLLIFDEVISGFRLGFTGATGFYDIPADILTFGKILGGGLPVGAYAASDKIMSTISPDGPVYQAGTLSGNPLAMKAGIAQLKKCMKLGFYTELEKKTSEFVNTITTHTKSKGYVFNMYNIGSIFWIAFSDKPMFRSASEIDHNTMETFRKFYHLLLEKGVYLGPSGYEVGFISSAHTDADLKSAASKIIEVLDQVLS